MLIKWIFRELRNNRRFTILFVLNLALGLSGFIALDSFKTSLNQVLEKNSKNFLSADMSVSARRPITSQELALVDKLMGPQVERSHLWEFFSMVSVPSGAKLVQIKAIENQYPFYGEMTLGSGRTITRSSQKEIFSEMAVWVYPELLVQLGLKVGDSIRLGEAEYRIADTISLDSTQTFRLSSLAPKIYGSLEMIKKSGLIEKGTTFTDAYLFRLPESVDPEKLRKLIFEQIADPGFQVTTGNMAAQETGRGLSYLSDYLGLVSLVALFLAGIGSAYLYRSYFSLQLKSVATLNALGLTVTRIRQFLIGQILLLGVLASAISAVMAVLIFPVLRLLLQELSQVQVPLVLTLRILGLAVLMATVGSLSVSLPFLQQIGRLRGSQLFQEESSILISWKARDFLILLVPTFLFWILSCWQANSLKTGSLFFGLLVGCLVAMLVLNWAIFKGLGRSLAKAGWKLRHIGLQLGRKQSKTLSCALALSLGSLLLNLLPQLKSTIKDEMASPQGGSLPALFVFDIQEDQVSGLKSIFDKKGYHDLNISPLVRARILKVNEKSFEKVTEAGRLQTREEETEARFRNRGFNLTYRDRLSSSETITAGQLWQNAFSNQSTEIPQISVEEKFAERLKFSLGDVLAFDVQGVEIRGRITSFRSVKWNSFQPNFFVVFQPGVLDEAPKTFLVALPQLPQVKVDSFQSELVAHFPNLSIVDVGRTVDQIVGLSDKMSWSLEMMASLCLGVGFLVLYTIISHQVTQSRWDLNLLKILGADSRDTLWSMTVEFAAIGFVSSALGAVLSVVVAYILAHQIFESPLKIDALSLALSVSLITLLSGVMAWTTARKVSLEKPQLILQS